ncbi:MAG: GNAT family N-acetyltransferase [Bacteroidales bacterium]|jgi:putative acetyltransferase
MKNTKLQIELASGTFLIRPVAPSDNPYIRDIILETLIEHGAVGGGFASGDQDTQQMFEAFQQEGRRYFVIEKEGKIWGGAGFASLPGEPGTCELVKMYFRREVRGLGLGKRLLQLCLEEAKMTGYNRIYLETVEQMHAARGLYEHLGFKQIPNQMGNTGHFSCDVFYLRPLV